MERSLAFVLLFIGGIVLFGCSVEAPTSQQNKIVAAKPIRSLFHPLSGIPTSDSLLPVFPNPFSRASGDTTVLLRFTIKDTSRTLMLIQNPIGDEIARFVDSTLPPGTYPGSWFPVGNDGGALNPGLYFITLRVNDTLGNTIYINSRLLNINDN